MKSENRAVCHVIKTQKCVFLHARCPTTCMCTGDLERMTIDDYPKEECPTYPGWQGPPNIPIGDNETCSDYPQYIEGECIGESNFSRVACDAPFLVLFFCTECSYGGGVLCICTHTVHTTLKKHRLLAISGNEQGGWCVYVFLCIHGECLC